jgi:hypothetical protein
MNSTEKFGNWSREELLDSLQRGLSEPLIDSEAPVNDQFYANTINALRKYAKNFPHELHPSIFILSAEIPKSLFAEKTFQDGRRLNSGEVDFGSKVWFVNSRVQRGKYFSFKDNEVNQTIDFLMRHDLNNAAAILYNPKDTDETISYFAQGLDEDSTSCISLEPAFVTAEKIKEGIERLYEGTLKTPGQATSANAAIWTNPAKWYPAENVEKEIQGRLQSYFYGQFSCNLMVISEISTGEGRLDMLLVSPDAKPGYMVHHALLELKALRSFSHTGKTPYNNNDHMDWIEKGTVQAIAYKKVHNPLHTALCCFDMCKDELTDDYWFGKFKKLAEDDDVKQWRWRLYNSANSYRIEKHLNSKN